MLLISLKAIKHLGISLFHVKIIPTYTSTFNIFSTYQFLTHENIINVYSFTKYFWNISKTYNVLDIKNKNI